MVAISVPIGFLVQLQFPGRAARLYERIWDTRQIGYGINIDQGIDRLTPVPFRRPDSLSNDRNHRVWKLGSGVEALPTRNGGPRRMQIPGYHTWIFRLDHPPC